MSEQATKHGILVAVDGSPESDAAVHWAAREAELRQLPITLAHVFEEPGTLEKVAELARDWFIDHLSRVVANR